MNVTEQEYVDGNAAAGELSGVFMPDITTGKGQCAHCGTKQRLAEAHVYLNCPGVIARCALCNHVLLRLVSIRNRIFLDLRGLTYLSADTTHSAPLAPLARADA